jgi:hypothetical protein
MVQQGEVSTQLLPNLRDPVCPQLVPAEGLSRHSFQDHIGNGYQFSGVVHCHDLRSSNAGGAGLGDGNTYRLQPVVTIRLPVRHAEDQVLSK